MLKYFPEHTAGAKFQKWPERTKYAYIYPSEGNTAVETTITDLNLYNGRKYTLEVVAVNGAQFSSKHQSLGVTVDITPPVMSQV